MCHSLFIIIFASSMQVVLHFYCYIGEFLRAQYGRFIYTFEILILDKMAASHKAILEHCRVSA